MTPMRVTAAILAGALYLAAPVLAQDMPPMPRPGPEHELLKQDVGTWNAVVEIYGGPEGPMKSTGVETNRMGCGGLCLISDFTGEMMPGTKFEGHGVAVYDPKKKAYVSTWTDSMSVGLSTGEATYDPAKKALTGTMTGRDAQGNMTTMRMVSEHKGDTRVMTMYVKGPDGKEMPSMRITYTKKT